MIHSSVIADALGIDASLYKSKPLFARINHDTRTIQKNDLFIPRPHGGFWTEERLVHTAIEKGASGIVSSMPLPDACPSTYFHVSSVRASMQLIYSLFYPKTPHWIIAVTGTNGKTSVSFFLHQLWSMAKIPNASIGTLGIQTNTSIPSMPNGSDLTTPTQPLLHNILATCKKHHIDHTVFEYSSQALDQNRADPLHPNMGIFTSFGRDHLDYHGSIDHYAQAKWTLFKEKIQSSGYVLLCNSIPNIAEKGMSLSNLNVIYYGHQRFAVKNALNSTFEIINAQESYQDVRFSVGSFTWESRVHLTGGFQVENILAALSAFHYGGGNLNQIIPSMSLLAAPPGRLQSIFFHHRKVYIDYAHTPCALEKSLSALRPYTKGNLIVLFGCGGNRDPLKRKEMGRVACERADRVIITDDNPRYEDPQSIHRDIQQECPKGKAIPDRKKAILYAMNLMQEHDTLLIAGKGHEATQNIQGRIVELSDQAVVESILNLSRPSNR